MKKLITSVAVLSLLVTPTVVLAKPDKPPKEEHKVTICHATSAEDNPWVRIVVDEHAIKGHFDNPGTPKAGHEDDVLLQGDVACPIKEAPPEEEPGTPTDTPKETPKVETPPTTQAQVEQVESQEPLVTQGK